MLLLITLSLLVLMNGLFLFRFFKSKETEDKILFQTMPSFFFWVVIIFSSFVAKSIFSANDAVYFGYDLIILGVILTILTTFIMGMSGSLAALKKRNTPYMIVSLLSVLIIVFPVALGVFPIGAVYFMYRKQKQKQKLKEDKKQKRKEAKKKRKKTH